MPSEHSRSAAAALRVVLEEERYRAMSAEDLLGRYINERDELAFTALVRRYGRLVMARCRDVLVRDELAQEAFQETFIQLITHAAKVRRRAAIGLWLARTARRRALNIARRERRQRARDLSVEHAECQQEPFMKSVAEDRNSQVARALSTIPERYRLPIELVYMDGHTHAEAARLLGWSKGTVNSYVHRGLARLKPVLQRSGVGALVVTGTGLVDSADAVPADWVASRVASSARSMNSTPTLLAGHSFAWKAIGGITTVGVLAIGAGLALWPHSTDEGKSGSPPPAVVESLEERNLRLLSTRVGPEVCTALKPLAASGTDVSLISTDARDSRAIVVIEGCFRPKLPAVGDRTQIAFVYDTGSRRRHVFIDRRLDGNWRIVDLEKPLILAKIPALKIEWTMKLPELTNALEVFDEIPSDPRAEAVVLQRSKELRNWLRRYAGTWYRDGQLSEPCRVEEVEPLGLAFYRPGDLSPWRVISADDAWSCEVGTRAMPVTEHGLLQRVGVSLLEDGKRLEFIAPNDVPWHRVPMPPNPD